MPSFMLKIKNRFKNTQRFRKAADGNGFRMECVVPLLDIAAEGKEEDGERNCGIST